MLRLVGRREPPVGDAEDAADVEVSGGDDGVGGVRRGVYEFHGVGGEWACGVWEHDAGEA